MRQQPHVRSDVYLRNYRCVEILHKQCSPQVVISIAYNLCDPVFKPCSHVPSPKFGSLSFFIVSMVDRQNGSGIHSTVKSVTIDTMLKLNGANFGDRLLVGTCEQGFTL